MILNQTRTGKACPRHVAPCCKECNFIKHDRNYKEFIAWIKQVYEHLLGATDGS